MLRCCTISFTSTHTSFYAAARSLALPHIRHATSQNSLLCWWLQSLEKSLQTTSARKTPQMAKLCPQPRWVCEALGRKPAKKSSSLVGTQTLDRQWDWLKTRFPGSWIHMKTADKTSEKIGSTCMLQSGARASKAMSWTTSDNFVLERKKGTFRRNPRRTKLLFRACKTLDFPLLKRPFQGICTRNLFQEYKHV